MNCRYTCCGCWYRNSHKVLSFEGINTNSETTRCAFVELSVSSPTASNGEFFCISFKAIPTDLDSHPIKVTINEDLVSIETKSGRTVTTADLYEGITLSGMYIVEDETPRLVIC